MNLNSQTLIFSDTKRVDKNETKNQVDEIDQVLPQWQCRRCGYDDCYAYAQAIVLGAPINQCPPGGEAVLQQLAKITGDAALLAEGVDPDLPLVTPLKVSSIEEDQCIGCTRCIQACPLDAIVGGRRAIHYVLPDLCSGCELCLPVCPMDCIVLKPSSIGDWQTDDSRESVWRRAACRRRQRLHNEAQQENGKDVEDVRRVKSAEYSSWVDEQVATATQKAAQLLESIKVEK